MPQNSFRSDGDLLTLQDDLHQVKCQMKALDQALPRFYEDGVDAETGSGFSWLFDHVLIQFADLEARLDAYAKKPADVAQEWREVKRQAKELVAGRQQIAVS